jgi:hypothetical protein
VRFFQSTPKNLGADGIRDFVTVSKMMMKRQRHAINDGSGIE